MSYVADLERFEKYSNTNMNEYSWTYNTNYVMEGCTRMLLVLQQFSSGMQQIIALAVKRSLRKKLYYRFPFLNQHTRLQ